MLPTPATSRRYQVIHRKDAYLVQHGRFNRFTLLGPSRVTNLGILILGGSLLLSLLFNLRAFVFRYSQPENQLSSPTFDTRRRTSVPRSVLETIQRDQAFTGLEHLIIVAGHAVWKGCTPDGRLDEMNWILEEKQKGGGNVNAFFRHIEAGAGLLNEDDTALLVFSGGQTRPTSLLTEAQSYHQLASASDLIESHAVPRVATENFALDSYQNLLFSLARFHEVTGNYPRYITVIGFGIKRKRFQDLHRKAVRWPLEQFHYVGIDVDGDTSAAEAGELEFGFTPYSKDLYGCHTELVAKRRRRNPFQVYHPYHMSAPELSSLMEWCPSGSHKNDIYPGALPWDHS